MSARMNVRTAFAAIALLALGSLPATAQKRSPIETTIGGVWMGGYSLGDRDANLTTNDTAGSPYTLFKSTATMNSAGGLDARVGWRATPMLTFEGALTWARPVLSTRLYSDAENAAEIRATETTSQYIIEGAVVAALLGGRRALVPFVRAGFGYLRELHGGNSLVETGTSLHLGGGATYWFGDIARQRIGLRVDGRYYMLRNGLNLGSSSRSLGAVSGGVVFGF
jgi:hypothetical protein